MQRPSLDSSINAVTVPRRALKYLHDLAKEVFCHHTDEPNAQPAADEDGGRPGPGAGPKSLKGKKGLVQGKDRFSSINISTFIFPFKLSLFLPKNQNA